MKICNESKKLAGSSRQFFGYAVSAEKLLAKQHQFITTATTVHDEKRKTYFSWYYFVSFAETLAPLALHGNGVNFDV